MPQGGQTGQLAAPTVAAILTDTAPNFRFQCKYTIKRQGEEVAT